MSLGELTMYALLVLAGVAAGWLNTVAGGGSLLSIPALMWCGLPVDVANGTSRVAILAQGVAAVSGFRREKQLDLGLLAQVSLPSVLGACLGSYAATLIPNAIFKPILIATLLGMAGTMFLRPETLSPPPDAQPLDPSASPRTRLALFLTGFYGGFLQAGVGLLLLMVFAGLMRIDLVRGNALKAAVIFLYSIAVVLIFAARSRVAWTSGAVLAVGNVIGAEAGVRFSVKRGQGAIKKVVFAMILVSALSLYFK